MIIGITRIRNEEHIIKQVLDHVSRFVDIILIYDDCSIDHTVEICRAVPKVTKIIEGETWAADAKSRYKLEGILRQRIYEEALKYSPAWVYYFDGDEFADFEGIDFRADAYKMRLYDFYITPEDKELSWQHRKFIGPEYRDILMLWRANKGIFFKQGHRQPTLPAGYKVRVSGSVKHYGKAISIEEWERTCDYYINHQQGPKGHFIKKWTGRKGKALHSKSDFGRPLITWDERKIKGIKLTERN